MQLHARPDSSTNDSFFLHEKAKAENKKTIRNIQRRKEANKKRTFNQACSYSMGFLIG